MLSSRGLICPFSSSCFRWTILFAWPDRSSLLFSLLSPFPLFALTIGQKDVLLISLIACLFLGAYPVGRADHSYRHREPESWLDSHAGSPDCAGDTCCLWPVPFASHSRHYRHSTYPAPPIARHSDCARTPVASRHRLA